MRVNLATPSNELVQGRSAQHVAHYNQLIDPFLQYLGINIPPEPAAQHDRHHSSGVQPVEHSISNAAIFIPPTFGRASTRLLPAEDQFLDSDSAAALEYQEKPVAPAVPFSAVPSPSGFDVEIEPIQSSAPLHSGHEEAAESVLSDSSLGFNSDSGFNSHSDHGNAVEPVSSGSDSEVVSDSDSDSDSSTDSDSDYEGDASSEGEAPEDERVKSKPQNAIRQSSSSRINSLTRGDASVEPVYELPRLQPCSFSAYIEHRINAQPISDSVSSANGGMVQIVTDLDSLLSLLNAYKRECNNEGFSGDCFFRSVYQQIERNIPQRLISLCYRGEREPGFITDTEDFLTHHCHTLRKVIIDRLRQNLERSEDFTAQLRQNGMMLISMGISVHTILTFLDYLDGSAWSPEAISQIAFGLEEIFNSLSQEDGVPKWIYLILPDLVDAPVVVFFEQEHGVTIINFQPDRLLEMNDSITINYGKWVSHTHLHILNRWLKNSALLLRSSTGHCSSINLFR